MLLIASASLASCTGFLKFGDTGPSFNKIMKSTDYDYKLRMAEKYYINKDYNHAQQLYDELFRVMKGSEHFEDIYYKFAYSAYYLRDYLNAENLFKGFVDAFPNSPRAEEMDYMRAFTFYLQSPKVQLDQTNTTKTIGFMQAFISTHPGSARIKDANDIIEKCRAKLEQKDFENAKLYYDLKASNPSFLRAASLTFNLLLNTYPDSERGDLYKLYIIRTDYEYAGLSTPDKKESRFEQVITDCNDFFDRFAESKYKKEVQDYLKTTTTTVKTLQNEQIKKAS